MATENLLKIMENAFHFSLTALFILKIFFGHAEKWFDWKGKVNFKIYDVTNWETNNRNTHIAQYLKK